MSFEFYLGTHEPSWLWRIEDIPLFVSHRRLRRRKSPFPAATTKFALDSGGFTELQKYGAWQVTPEQYVEDVQRFATELGTLAWAAQQDHMCEPWILQGGTYKGQHFVGTGLTVKDHQELTIENYLTLRDLDPTLPFRPSVQGWKVDDYHRHIDMYAANGVDLTREAVVGVGSVCRRESTREAALLFETLAARGLALHGFGVKTSGLTQYVNDLVSSDSLAWSSGARRNSDRGPRTCGKKSCQNCLHYALEWRARLLAGLTLNEPRQLSMFLHTLNHPTGASA